MKPLKKYCYSIFFISLLSSTSFANPNSNNQVLLGYGIDDSSVDLPLLLSSNETGEHWSYSSAIFGLPSTANFNGQSAFHSIACTESFCTISGFQNLLLISQNKGLSWSTINNIQNLPASFKSYDISCADKNSCTIVGSYFRASGSYPVLLTTHDSGNSWLANNDISHNPGILSHVSCSDKTCVAAGNVSNAKKLPYILASQDSGNSWTEIKNINGISSIKNPFITDIDCNKNICTASGYYTLNSARMPLLLTSNDKGMSWSAVDINTPNGLLNKVTCTDTNCFAT